MRDRIIKEQERQIETLYLSRLESLREELKQYEQGNLTQSELRSLQRRLNDADMDLNNEVVSIIKANIDRVVLIATTTSIKLLLSKVDGDKAKFKNILNDMFKDGNIQASKAVLDGRIYKDGRSLSERIWGYHAVFKADLNMIIAKGIASKKSSYEIAKDLEKYVNPKYKKLWEWSKVYPTSTKVIDYNAQRLARTAVNHAWQEAVKENVDRNPYTTYIEWHSALIHGRTCQQCKDRHGQRYLVKDLPYDHPMGLCTMIPVLDKSLEEIAEDLKRNYG